MEFKKILEKRKSIRVFSEKKVSKEDIREIVADAQTTPSWVNSQPCKVFVATGDVLEKIRNEYIEMAKSGVRGNPDFEVRMNEEWQEFPRKNMEMAPEYSLIGGIIQDGIFNAPAIVVLTIPKDSTKWSVLDLGGFAQTLVLSAGNKGIDSIHAYAVIKRPDIIRKYMNIPEDFDIATGIALGYKVEGDPVNELKTERLPLDEILEIYE